MPAIGFRESRENYAKQHGADDTIDGVDFHYLAQNARVNAAGMATLALAPPPPVVVTPARRADDRSPAVRLRRAPALEGVARRRRLSHLLAQGLGPDWEHELAVGNVTEYTLPKANIDDWVFGVAAVDAAGHESTVSVYVARPPKRREMLRWLGDASSIVLLHCRTLFGELRVDDRRLVRRLDPRARRRNR